MNIYWIGYSWFLGPKTSYLCISNIKSSKTTSTENSKEKMKSKDDGNRVVKWPSKLEAVSPPDPGIVNTIGISGIGGYLLEAQTTLSPHECSWRKQIQLLEDHFERLLADILMGTINDILSPVDKDKHLYIILQGPAFPKLLGRLSYRHLRQHYDNTHIYFMTFRRRFLTPNPLLQYGEVGLTHENEDFEGMIYGPAPSHHEEAIVRKYYVLPSISRSNNLFVHEQSNLMAGNYCPLMIETFEQNTARRNDSEALGELLKAIGMTVPQNAIMVPSEGDFRWQIYPSDFAFQKVLVPLSLLEVHKQSGRKLKEVMGEPEQTSRLAKKLATIAFDDFNNQPKNLIAAREEAEKHIKQLLDKDMLIN